MKATCVAMIVIVCCHTPIDRVEADETFFRQQVAPVLERHCVGCHQGEEPKGALSLATLKGVQAGGDSGPAIEPGKPDDSLLIDYISGDEPEMPKDGKPLKPQEVEAIRQWIAAGAAWPDDLTLVDKKEIDADWWSLKPLAQISVPAVDSAWPRTPIDSFILAKLQENQLSPAPEADRRTLIRRLFFDLHGLPPTPEQINAFLADQSPDAYERLVDRLLASPRYGERWGRHWLDVVHFGESHGYDKDKPRANAWPYRDYVIAAFNSDKPYSRFIEEQLAGDVLYPDDGQATVATGFIAAGPWDFVGHVELREGTVDKAIARSNDRDDMVATTMSTFVSLTVHCARCHNHKFDPIKQEDYYRLQAVFAGVDRADRPFDADPQVARTRFALNRERRELQRRGQALREMIAKIKSPEIQAIDGRLSELQRKLAELKPEPGQASSTLGYHSQIMPDSNETKWVQVDLGAARVIDQVVLVPAHVVYGGHPGPGFGFPPRFKVEVSDHADFRGAEVLADHTAEDFPHPGDNPYRINAAAQSGRYVRVTATRLWERTNDWIFALAELQVISGDRNVATDAAVTSLDSIEAPPGWSMKNLVDGYSSLERLEGPSSSTAALRQEIATQVEQATLEQRKLIQAAIDPADREAMAAVDARLAEVNRQLAQLPAPAMVYAAAPEFDSQGNFSASKTPRPVHLLARGDVRSPQQLMPAGAVACVAGPDHDFKLDRPDDEGARRAALARWLSDPSNALVRRSIVNRVWHYHFGQGIVDTPNDFGRMGSLPSHPELLDWLAGWFLQNGESLKKLHKLILMSSVYRQSSEDHPEHARIDAGNRLLWRMNRQRLDAECVRDAMLLAGGKLDPTMGGPSVQQFHFKDDHSPVYDYARFDVDDPRNFRRSIYRFIVRSVPDPFMDCMDCADPSILTPKRNTTLTSIQALAMLNNKFTVRQAEHLAQRASTMSPTVAGQVQTAFRLALGRDPTDDESRLLSDYASRHGLANACRVIFNSNEFLFVD